MGKANQKLEGPGKVGKSLTEANKKALGVEAKRLKIEVLEAKSIGIIEFKDSEAYKFDLIENVTLFLAKKKIKMNRLLWRHH